MKRWNSNLTAATLVSRLFLMCGTLKDRGKGGWIVAFPSVFMFHLFIVFVSRQVKIPILFIRYWRGVSLLPDHS